MKKQRNWSHHDLLGKLPREEVIRRVKEAKIADRCEETLNRCSEDIWKWKTGQGYWDKREIT